MQDVQGEVRLYDPRAAFDHSGSRARPEQAASKNGELSNGVPDMQTQDRNSVGQPMMPEVEADRATDEENFLCALGEELAKRELPFLNDVLRQLLTLSVSLLGGGIFFLSADNCQPGLRLFAMIMFFLSLLLAFIGMLPASEKINLSIPESIKDAVQRLSSWKTGFVKGAGVFLILGLGAAFLGVLLK
jgi:hypothetical protein